MAAISWTDVANHYAALATAVSVGAQADILAYVNDEALDASVFGGDDSIKFKLARIHLAAHIGEIERRSAGGAVGGVTSKSVSGTSLSVTYGAGAMSDDVLLTTPGGSALRQLIRTSPKSRLFARCSR